MTDPSACSAAYDGPIPPAEVAAARWGEGAWARLARGADVALIEARLRACLSVLARLRRGGAACAGTSALARIAHAIAAYRRYCIAILALR